MDLSTRYRTVHLLGVQTFAMRLSDVLQLANERIAARTKLLIGVVNVAKVVNARKDPALREALAEADIVVADGAPLVWLSRMKGDPLPERVAGIDLMFELLKESDRRHYAVYFLGAKQAVLEEVVRIVKRDYPGLSVAGYRDGYFSPQDEPRVADEIRDSRADIIFVAISPPKKEIFLRKWGPVMNVPICHGVGGSFDVLAGVTRRAPRWMQKSGLEWFYRVLQEPRRMWKRYLVTNTQFIGLSLAEIVRCRLGRGRLRTKEGIQ
jgi:N-acetylglucosaminyldiphosphoundecaprenol N-acetyl-beta-D-mannosaminyltransferase